MSKVTEHATGLAEILFMAVARPMKNNKTGKEEFSIKVKLLDDDKAVSHLSDVADYKVDTKTNRANAGQGFKVINFSTTYAPTVLDVHGNRLEGNEIPFFDGRSDSGKAYVSYKLIDYGDNKIVRLSGVRLMEINLAEREGSSSIDVTLETLKNIG